MSNADEIRRLKEEIITSFETRIDSIANVVKSTKEMTGRFRNEHFKMRKNLHADLNNFKTNLSHAETERAKQMQTEAKERMIHLTNIKTSSI